MPIPGYSGTPLLKKLGIKPEMKIKLIHAPEAYYEWLEADISNQLAARSQMPDFIHLFSDSKNHYETEMTKLRPLIASNPQILIWVSWHKKSSGIPTDLTEDHIRKFALGNGLVDIKVCAVSAEWSGLKLVVPLAAR
jgi:hypothetical protein